MTTFTDLFFFLFPETLMPRSLGVRSGSLWIESCHMSSKGSLKDLRKKREGEGKWLLFLQEALLDCFDANSLSCTIET